MEKNRKNVIIGMPGLFSDNPNPRMDGSKEKHWRPSLSACMHFDDFPVDRFVLIHEERCTEIANHLASDIRDISPHTKIESFKLDDWTNPWDFQEVYGALDAFALEYEFDEEEEDYFVHITTGTHAVKISWFALIESRAVPAQILQTSRTTGGKGNGSNVPKWDLAKEGLQLDKGNYVKVDFQEERYDAIHKRFQIEHAEQTDILKMGIKTRNKSFNKLIEEIKLAAVNSPKPILLTGPTGVGKSTIAKRIFEIKKEAKMVVEPFVSVNCATLRDSTAASTLFGHVSGAFTGADNNRPGLLKKADKGVLFLDEIGTLGVDEQAMLLNALEEKIFYPLGSDEVVESDFQLIAGTNADLVQAVGAGEFRSDLLARIDTWVFDLPPLSARKEDIEPNVDFELDQLSGELGKQVSMNKQARERFLKFAKSSEAIWPSNFRDLNKAFHRMVSNCKGNRIGGKEVKKEIKGLQNSWRQSIGSDLPLCRHLLGERFDQFDLFELFQLEHVLEICRKSSNMADAGRQLYRVSRAKKKKVNDSARISQYLKSFALNWRDVNSRLA